MSARVAARPKQLATSCIALQPSTPVPRHTYITTARERHPRNYAASSIYSVPDIEAINTVRDQQGSVRINKSDAATQTPWDLSRRQPMRIMTRNGKALCADGVFRDQVLSLNTARRAIQPSSNALRRAYSHRRNGLILQLTPAVRTFSYDEDVGESDDGLQCESSIYPSPLGRDPARTEKGTFRQGAEGSRTNSAYRPRDGKLSATAPRPLDNVTLQDLFEEPVRVPASRFVVPDEKLYGHRTRSPSLIRRLSNSMKTRLSVLSSGNKDTWLGPSHVKDVWGRDRTPLPTDLKHNPVEAVRRKASRKKGIQITVVTSTPPSALSAAPKGQKILGHPDRDTRWSDFMRADGSGPDRSPDSDPQTIPRIRHVNLAGFEKALPPLPLQVPHTRSQRIPKQQHSCAPHPIDGQAAVSSQYPLEVERKLSLRKRVDTSRKSWMPPDRKANVAPYQEVKLPTPKVQGKVEAYQCFDMTPNFPSVNDLFDPIEAIIDDYAHREEHRPGDREARVVRSQYRRKRQEQRAGRREHVEAVATMEDFMRVRDGRLNARCR